MLLANQIESIPRIFRIQDKNCDPLSKAFQKGLDEPIPINKKETLAERISSSDPIKGKEILSIIRKTNGKIISVSENGIWKGLKALVKVSFFVEPTSATVDAELKRLIREDEIETGSKTVVILTGSGLKAIDKIVNKK